MEEKNLHVRIVPMTADHLDEVAELERICFSTPWSRNMLAEELDNYLSAFLVALDDNDKVAGYAGLQAVLDEGYITNVAVRPDCRKQGVASKLLQVFLDFAQAKERGYVETLFHRRRELPEIRSSNFNMRSFGERVALNMPIQGTAADIMKLAMVAVEKRLKRELPEAKLVLQVHDELIVECPKPQAAAAAKLLEEEMEQVAHLSVPLTAEAHWGRNWLEAKG